ncbi:DNA-processing protein DprA [soil metagenome]
MAVGPDADDPTDSLNLEAALLVALSSLPGLGPATVWQCHRQGEAQRAWSAVSGGRPGANRVLAAPVGRMGDPAVARLVEAARSLDPMTELSRHRAHDRRVLVHGRAGYPDRLHHDPAPPAVLFAEGDANVLSQPTVAVVGTRNATRAGRELAVRLGAELAEAGASVVSGLALGIDGSAHQGALEHPRRPRGGEPTTLGSAAAAAAATTGGAQGTAAGPGGPVGVIASGLDIAYPRRHAALHRQVAAGGLLVSETPLGHRPVGWRFPARNRIIAGLADAVVVVESRSAGGSMLTVKEALDRGVDVLAVPGHPTAPAASGTNDLIFDGATIVRSTDDVLHAVGLGGRAPSGPRRERAETATLASRSVLDVLGHTPAALSEIVTRTGLDLGEVSRALVELEATGRVVRSAGWYERCSSGGDPVRGKVP